MVGSDGAVDRAVGGLANQTVAASRSAPVVAVYDDARHARADAELLLREAFFNNGKGHHPLRRVYVPEGITVGYVEMLCWVAHLLLPPPASRRSDPVSADGIDGLTDDLIARVEAFKVGAPLEPTSDLAWMASVSEVRLPCAWSLGLVLPSFDPVLLAPASIPDTRARAHLHACTHYTSRATHHQAERFVNGVRGVRGDLLTGGEAPNGRAVTPALISNAAGAADLSVVGPLLCAKTYRSVPQLILELETLANESRLLVCVRGGDERCGDCCFFFFFFFFFWLSCFCCCCCCCC